MYKIKTCFVGFVVCHREYPLFTKLVIMHVISANHAPNAGLTPGRGLKMVHGSPHACPHGRHDCAQQCDGCKACTPRASLAPAVHSPVHVQHAVHHHSPPQSPDFQTHTHHAATSHSPAKRHVANNLDHFSIVSSQLLAHLKDIPSSVLL
jgi:hypothetical protein